MRPTPQPSLPPSTFGPLAHGRSAQLAPACSRSPASFAPQPSQRGPRTPPHHPGPTCRRARLHRARRPAADHRTRTSASHRPTADRPTPAVRPAVYLAQRPRPSPANLGGVTIGARPPRIPAGIYLTPHGPPLHPTSAALNPSDSSFPPCRTSAPPQVSKRRRPNSLATGDFCTPDPPRHLCRTPVNHFVVTGSPGEPYAGGTTSSAPASSPVSVDADFTRPSSLSCTAVSTTRAP